MADREEQVEAIRRRPRQVRYPELERILLSYDFVVRAGKGDHRVFSHPLLPELLTIDPRRPFLLVPYVRKALRAIASAIAAEEGGRTPKEVDDD